MGATGGLALPRLLDSVDSQLLWVARSSGLSYLRTFLTMELCVVKCVKITYL